MHRHLPLLACLLAAAPPAAALDLHPTLGDHAVLQRDRPVPVRGTATPGATVRVALLAEGGPAASAEAVADGRGRFRVELPAHRAGGPFRLLAEELDAGGEPTASVALGGLLFGDVWVASGQSNMRWSVAQSDGAEAVSALEVPGVRHLQVRLAAEPEPVADPPAAWHRTEPGSTPGFSAVAHHFALSVHEATGVPVGILHASWGGTPAGAWTPRAALRSNPVTAPMVAADEAAGPPTPEQRARHAEALAAWERRYGLGGPESPRHLDPGDEASRAAEAARYADPGFDDAGWTPVTLPHELEDLHPGGGEVDGVAWYRRRVRLPPELVGVPLTLGLGRIDDADTAYVDGVEVGRTPQTDPKPYEVDRRYPVPAGATADGELVVAVRVLDDFGGGGFTGPAGRVRLEAAGDPDAAVPLTGGWRAALTEPLAPLGRPWVGPPAAPWERPAQHRPGFLWNGMASGLTGTPASGVIWYQGESDANQAERYRTLFPLLIRSWREAWGRPDLPFFFVQLARFRAPVGEEFEEGGWGPIREAQAHAAQTVPGAAMAVILDLDDPDPLDIHPGNKADVGRRLALLALRDAYGRDVVAEGPRVERVRRDGDAVEVTFRSADPPLVTDDGAAPAEFWLRGADGTTRRASAELGSTTLRLRAEGVDEPVEVIYAWATNPAGVNLTDGSGLPTAPFRLRLAE